MIDYLVGNIIDSPAECLVNTVNCEGFMGKGIAYQFKLKFPENEKAYQQACRKKELKIGKVFLYQENNKMIANFPTKDEWRKNSQYEYIQMGMADLADKILKNNIKSIAIPPLGCGNGGLEWHTVKKIILTILAQIDNENKKILIYEPSKHYKTIPTKIPKLAASHLLLLAIKNKLQVFDKIRLQKSAFFMCLFAKDDFFKFEEYNYGPYSHAIEICSRNIKEFQDYYNITSPEAESLAKNNLISDNIQKQIDKYAIPISRATDFINSIPDDATLEIIATLAAIVHKQPGIDKEHIFERFYTWSKQKKQYGENEVYEIFNKLNELNIITHSLMGYELNENFYDNQKTLRYQR
jgi:O-acetyl-ADP-ribose deacetylase (regulator of RNase III)